MILLNKLIKEIQIKNQRLPLQKGTSDEYYLYLDNNVKRVLSMSKFEDKMLLTGDQNGDFRRILESHNIPYSYDAQYDVLYVHFKYFILK